MILNGCFSVSPGAAMKRRHPMSASHVASIEASGLVREFKKGPRAVDGIDLHIAPGEIYGFLGPNGAGKSTTTLMLTTLLPPTAGSARVAGYDVVREGPQVRGLIGAALQEAALDPLLTGREHMRLQTALHDVPRQQRARRGEELLVRLGLADGVGIIDQGRIVAEGTPAHLKSEIGRPSVEVVPQDAAQRARLAAVLERFGEPTESSRKGAAVRLRGGERDLADVVRALDAEGIAVEHIQLHAPSLDDVFLAKTGRSLEGAGDERAGAREETAQALRPASE